MDLLASFTVNQYILCYTTSCSYLSVHIRFVRECTILMIDRIAREVQLLTFDNSLAAIYESRYSTLDVILHSVPSQSTKIIRAPWITLAHPSNRVHRIPSNSHKKRSIESLSTVQSRPRKGPSRPCSINLRVVL